MFYINIILGDFIRPRLREGNWGEYNLKKDRIGFIFLLILLILYNCNLSNELYSLFKKGGNNI